MGCHAGIYARTGAELKAKSPLMQDGMGCVRSDNRTKHVHWYDMVSDGGGWAVVAEQNMYTHNQAYPEVTGVTPTTNPDVVNNCRVTDWPPYTEYGVRNIVKLNGVTNDGSLSQSFWKFNTGSFGTVQCDMMSFLLNKSDYQGGRASDAYVMYNGSAWGDAHSHYAYSAYRWFDSASHVYNHWGQSDMFGHIVSSDLFRVASSVTGFGRTAGCGTGWASDSCRLGKNNWVYRNTVKHKAVFMVR